MNSPDPVLHRPQDLSGRDQYGFAPVVVTPAGAALVFVAGQLPDDPTAGFAEQASQVFTHLHAALAVAGATPATVATIRCLVVDLTAERLEELSTARRALFHDGLPTSTVIAVPRLVGPGLLLEVDAVAVSPAPDLARPATPVLPLRRGTRPATAVPTSDNQNASPVLQDELDRRARGLPGVTPGSSCVSAPGARACYLASHAVAGPAGALLNSSEFGHLHPPADGSLHLALPPAARAQVTANAWGEPHPLSATMLVFGPRDDDELEIVWSLVRISHAWATGGNH